MQQLSDHPGTDALRVLVADDHPLMLAGIRRALDRSESVEVVGEARSGPELLGMIERRQPEVVLMDLRMPGVAGSDCVERICSDWPTVKVVVLSACDDRASIDGALDAGASAYIVKSAEPTDIASVLRQTRESTTVFHAPRRLVGRAAPEEPAGPELTERERTILTAVAEGQTTAAISQSLWVSEHTVKFHLTNIYRKLGVPNRAGAVRYALGNGLVAA
ncbi:MAG TPA: response regulator transcription factor [Solirubrobacteraceae bacterium]|nr:response regulator transcription factor [Solirubrobacteraceae bacterium]